MAHSIKISNVELINTRDLGGIKVGDKTIKKNRLIRSGALTQASIKDLETLRDDHSLNLIIDLRNQTEAKQAPDQTIEGIESVLNPILSEAQMGMTHEKETDAKSSKVDFVSRVMSKENGIPFMKGLYLNFITDEYCLSQYSKFIKLVAKHKKGAILYHCSVGKDRVGIATFLIYKLLGVNENDIIEDFMLTNEFIEDDTLRNIAELASRIPSSSLEEVYRNLFTVRKEYIQAVIDTIDKLYGNFETFTKEILNITPETIQELKDNYLE